MPSAATSQILDSLQKADDGLKSISAKMIDVASRKNRKNIEKGYKQLANRIRERKEFLKNSSRSLNQVDLSAELAKVELAFSSTPGPNVPDDLRKDIRDMATDLELNDRLFALNRGTTKNEGKAEAALRWFSQKKDGQYLDFLFENTEYLATSYGAETRDLLTIAKESIMSRGYGTLIEFYDFSVSEMIDLIQRSIDEFEHLEPEIVKEYYRAECPTEVLERLAEMQTILEEYVEQVEIRRWLSTSNKLFGGATPRTAMITGKTFNVYQFLIGLAQGVLI